MAKRSPFDNLHSLWKKEDSLIQWAKEKIVEEDFLQDHIELIEAGHPQ